MVNVVIKDASDWLCFAASAAEKILQRMAKKGWVKIAATLFAAAFILGLISRGFAIAERYKGIVLWGELPVVGFWANGIAIVATVWTIICVLIEVRRHQLRRRR